MPLSFLYLFSWVLFGVLFRLAPHVANYSPLLMMCLWSSAFWRKSTALVLTLLILFLSDVGLHWICHYPLFGAWSVFDYSGFLMITLYGFHRFATTLLFASMVMANLFLWMWTNFGVWLGPYYPHTLAGLLQCYWMALPFLKNSIISSLMMFLLWGKSIWNKFSLRSPHNLTEYPTYPF